MEILETIIMRVITSDKSSNLKEGESSFRERFVETARVI